MNTAINFYDSLDKDIKETSLYAGIPQIAYQQPHHMVGLLITFSENLRRNRNLRVEISSPANMSIRASNLAFAMLIESSEEMDFRDLDANYIRQSEAEETKKRKEMGLKKIEY